MARLLQRSHLLFGLAAAMGFAACFIEPFAPGNLRFECSSDSECEANQRCASGLCQQPCGGEQDEPCNQEYCLNGYCSGVCSLADDQCSSPQTCHSLAFPGEEPGMTGVCTISCGDDAPCPEGQQCYEDLGLCVATCMVTEDCADGEECFAGFCVPSSG